ncbi:hypothetical protein [Salinarimonas ramus]|nr:hypothetical protein [Salinarimonas ramus]
MTRITRTLVAAALALAASSPAFASLPSEITIYDQPQQQDGFFKPQAQSRPLDVEATGSIGAPVMGGKDVWQLRETIRRNAEDHS